MSIRIIAGMAAMGSVLYFFQTLAFLAMMVTTHPDLLEDSIGTKVVINGFFCAILTGIALTMSLRAIQEMLRDDDEEDIDSEVESEERKS